MVEFFHLEAVFAGEDSGGIADFFWEEKGNLVCGAWCGAVLVERRFFSLGKRCVSGYRFWRRMDFLCFGNGLLLR